MLAVMSDGPLVLGDDPEYGGGGKSGVRLGSSLRRAFATSDVPTL